MRRSKIVALFALAGLGVFALVGIATGASNETNGSNIQANSKTTETTACNNNDGDGMGAGSGDTISFTGSKLLWPPNHKYRYVTVTATDVDNPDPVDPLDVNDHVTLMTSTTTNEPNVFGMGSGHTENDFSAPQSTQGTEVVTQTVALRGERNGKDPTHVFNGRTYTITAMATFDGPNASMGPNPTDSCTATFTVRVPHDMGHG